MKKNSKKSVHSGLDNLLQQAIQHYQQGRIQPAQRLLQQLSRVATHQIEALHWLALIALQHQQAAEAVRLLCQLLALQPHHGPAMANLGAAHKALGNIDQALLCYQQAIKLMPEAAETYYNRADALRAVERYQEAIQDYQQAIRLKPNYPRAYLNLGNTLQSLQRHAEAVSCYQQAMAYQADFALAYRNCGNAFKALGRHAEALRHYDKALALAPQEVDTHLSRIHLLSEMQQYPQLSQAFQQLQSITTMQVEWLAQWASALHKMGQYQQAAQCYQQAIQQQPEQALWHNLLGNMLQEQGELEAAVASYDQALALQPDYVEVYSNRGIPLYFLQRLNDSIASFDRAIQLKQGFHDAYWNKALALLLREDYAQGWQQYEYRWQSRMKQSARHFPQPLWLGQWDIAGKTILLHAEQGYGDTLQFCRYASLVAQLGANVILEVQPPLVTLMQGLAGVQQVIAQGQDLPAFDGHCPLMSLPLAFKTEIHSIPNPPCYLFAEASRVQQWQSQILSSAGANSTRPKVGVVWSASLRANQPIIEAWDKRKSIPLAPFAQALADCPVDFYSLQKGEPAESEIRGRESQFWPAGNFYNFAEAIQDFADTAALIAHLDLVICVDTSVTHLAAAMGKPTWVLNRFDTCWRWLQQRTDSPWYPSVTLYRQQRYRHWEDVLQKVRQDLLQWAQMRNAGALQATLKT